MEEQDQSVSTEAVYQREFYMDVDEAACHLNLSRCELLRRAEEGTVPAHKLWHGKQFCWKFKRSELDSELLGREAEFEELPIQ